MLRLDAAKVAASCNKLLRVIGPLKQGQNYERALYVRTLVRTKENSYIQNE